MKSLYKKSDNNEDLKAYGARTSVIAILASSFFIFLAGQFIGALFVVSLAMGLGSNRSQIVDSLESNTVLRFLIILSIEAITVWFVKLFLKRRRKTLKDIGLFGRPTWQHIRSGAKFFGIYFLTYLGVSIVLNASKIIDTNQQQQIGFSGVHGPELILVFISLAVLPPIAEEILFRGYLFSGLKRHIKHPIIPSLVTSLLFASAHLEFGSGASLNWAAAFDTFVLSMVLCYVVGKTKSLWPAILIHFAKNSLAFLFLFILKK